jgi:hypothetical protein
MNIRSVGAEMIHSENGQDEVESRFSQFSKRAQNE